MPQYHDLGFEIVDNINGFYKYENLMERREYNKHWSYYEINKYSNILLDSSSNCYITFSITPKTLLAKDNAFKKCTCKIKNGMFRNW